MELRGCSEEHTSRPGIQPPASERLRNAHMDWGTEVLLRGAGGAWHTPAMNAPVRRSGSLAALVVALLVAGCGNATPTPVPAQPTPSSGAASTAGPSSSAPSSGQPSSAAPSSPAGAVACDTATASAAPSAAPD